MNKTRATKINRAINNRDRSDVDYDDKSLSNCDVCWTCKYFDVQISSCLFSYQNALERFDFDELYDEEYYIVPVPIKDPSYFRCSAWFDKEKDGQETARFP